MQAVSTDSREPSWVMLAVAREADVAERWADALAEQGIEAHIRIDDAVALTAGSSFWPAGSSGFAYPLFVPAESRTEAATILVDEGWDGRFGNRRDRVDSAFVLRGAVVATLSGLALVVLLLIRAA
jgi:hypothetical protein